MFYPDQPTRINEVLQLFVPDPEQVRKLYEEALLQDPETSFPYWARIWPSARALTSFLLSEPDYVVGKDVLELGAGIGLPSFAIASLAANIHITDHAPEAVELLHKNIESLQLTNITASLMDWNDLPSDTFPEVLLLSDVNYAPAAFERLQKAIERMLQLGTTVILATPQRIMAVPFLNALQSFIKQSGVYTISENGEEVAVSVFVLRLHA